MRCRDVFGGKLGDIGFFRTELDLLESQDGVSGLKVWNPIGTNKRFSEVLNFDNLAREQQDIVHLFFTDQELKNDLDVGFRGHPAIGAAAMSLLTLHRDERPWSQLAEKIRMDVTQPAGSRVFVVGSVFGGTGASAIHPVVRFLRSVPETNHDLLKVGVAALVPYFQFRATNAAGAGAREMAARSEWFALATRSAAEFYNYVRESEQKDWDFNAMYWLGDDSLTEVNYSTGGPNQENPAHFVDLLAGVACLDFFETEISTKACYFAGPRECGEDGLKKCNVLSWDDIPLQTINRDRLRTKLLQFFLSGAVHTGFLNPLLNDDRLDTAPFKVPWYFQRFAVANDPLTTPAARAQLKLLAEFFSMFHYPWWRQIHDSELPRVRLFNKSTLVENVTEQTTVDLYRLSNLLWPDQPGEATMNKLDRFFTDMVDLPRNLGSANGVPSYLAMLGHTAERFIQREYAKQKEG